MKKHITIIVIILFAISSGLTFAQESATAVVKGIVKPFREKKNVEMTFTYQYIIDENNRTEEQHGSAFIQGESYKMLLNEQHTISDGKTIWTHFINEEEVVVSNASVGSDNTPLKLLTTLDNDYKASFIDNTHIMLSCVDCQIKLVTLTIDRKSGSLKGLEILATDGSKMVINITDVKYDQKLEDGFFSFDEKAFPNVDIIDMR